MSDNKVIIIREKIEIPKLRLWLIWLLLFVFPSLATIICFHYLSKEYKYFVNTDLIYEGFEKIKKYNDLIVPENYIENQQSIIHNLDTTTSSEMLKEQIDSILLGETYYCIFFDEDFNNAKVVKKTDAKNLSLPLLKRYFKTLVKDYYLKEQNPLKESDYKSSQAQLAIFIQSLFNTVTPISISINQTSKNFSVLQEGEIYFIFTKFINSNKECSWCFAILKGKDFSYTKMIKKLQNQFPEIT
ncbi:MAG: hypothetical protein J6Z11_02775, partial [Candidatus Riflebacteria bacterium]|nr:hypothetical protein [Candidatus Riflebacteria bacterium]